MKYIIASLFCYICLFINISHGLCMVPVLTMDNTFGPENNTDGTLKYLTFMNLIDKDRDTSEFWRETDILSLVRANAVGIDYDRCEKTTQDNSVVHINGRRTVRPICRNRIELLPQRRSYNEPCSCDQFRPETFQVKNRTYIHNHKCPCLTRRRFEIIRNPKGFKMRKNLSARRMLSTKNTDNDFDNYQLCPQCPHFNNHTECELFRDSCKERRVYPSEYRHYCDRKYGKWRAMFVPADYTQCRCCDECIFYRELDQSCVEDEYSLVTEEFLPTTVIDFRAGCNQYWGHPEQEFRSLRCDKILRRCVPVTVPQLSPASITKLNRNFRYEPPSNEDCPVSCLGYICTNAVREQDCPLGGFLPDKNQCNCCGHCSVFQQLNEKCAEFKKTLKTTNGTVEIEVEEEFLEPGCDDGLVCRHGLCEDIHVVLPAVGSRRKRDEIEELANEPCKRELKYFKKRYGPEGHLHFNAPQCTPLWLYAPVQCRRFVCYCALEDGSFIIGIKVPRVEVSNMNCDCARERCRTGSDIECDGYGNYKDATFTSNAEEVKTTVTVNDEDVELNQSQRSMPASTSSTTGAREKSNFMPTTARQQSTSDSGLAIEIDLYQ